MIKLNDYIKKLQEIVKENAVHGDLPVIYGVDDEGNAFHPVVFGPSLKEADNINERYLELIDEIENPNCVCIN